MDSRVGQTPQRLQKYMAACGVASRRRCDEMIALGRVQVNGVTVTAMGTTVAPGTDRVTLDGMPVEPPRQGLVYYMLNKPRGYLTTARDERGRPTVFDLLRSISTRVFPVGRLDLDSEGLLLLTNDGELAHRLMHPAFRVEKEYEVWIEGTLTAETVHQLERGVEIDNGVRTQPARVQLAPSESGAVSRSEARLFITIREGRKRQVRLMMAAVGHHVRRLRRVREGVLRLDNLAAGKVRPLTRREIADLRTEAGLK